MFVIVCSAYGARGRANPNSGLLTRVWTYDNAGSGPTSIDHREELA